MALHDDIRLAISNLPSVAILHLLETYGSAEKIFAATADNLREQGELTEKSIEKLQNPILLMKAEQELEFIDRYSIRALPFEGEGFPYRVAATPDSPAMLFVKGEIDFNASNAKWVSIIGTRKATENGYYMCDKIVEELAENFPDTVIVSGLAYGIDIAAHKAALRYGLKTVAVVAHGLDMIYPAAHRQYAKEMIEKGGAVVTEFPSTTPIYKANFVRRNRIIAALSDATIVVESAAKGGSLITADIADSYDREVFACPGRLVDKNYQGCNKLIKNNKASLYQDITDIQYTMGWEVVQSKEFALSLTSTEKKIYEAMGDEEITAEEISEKSSLAIYMVLSSLAAMEVNGIVKSIKARMYIKLK